MIEGAGGAARRFELLLRLVFVVHPAAASRPALTALRASREWARDCAIEKGDELSPVHSIPIRLLLQPLLGDLD
jgi:hypothetical protein